MIFINGKDYPTTIINGQTWTATNYDGLDEGGIVYNNNADTATVGQLYTVAEANAIPLPTGWRVPTEADFSKLQDAIGGADPVVQQTKDLMSVEGWTNGGGTNKTGFNAMPAGFYGDGNSSASQSFQDYGLYAVFIGGGISSCFYVYQYPSNAFATFANFYVQPSDRASLRFVKDN